MKTIQYFTCLFMSNRCVKLVRTNSNYCVLGTGTATINILNYNISMHLLPRINVMLDFI